MAEAGILIQTLQRDLNCLSDPDRSTRRRALERLQKRLLSGDPGDGAPPRQDFLQVAWDDTILRLVVRTISDPVEKCREISIQMISSVAKLLPQVDQTVLQILPLMEDRMGQIPVLEESEEIRLQLLNLIATVLLIRCPEMVCYNSRDHLFKIIMTALSDQFHEIKKAACQVIVLVGKVAPRTLEEKTEPLLKSLLININHSHFRVRLGALQAVDSVFQVGLPAGTVSEQLAPGVKPLAFDRATGLRAQFFTSVAGWLGRKESLDENHISQRQEKDPRPFITHLLPLLLLGVTDESKEVAANSLALVESVGEVHDKYVSLSRRPTDKIMVDAVGEMSLEGSTFGEDDYLNNFARGSGEGGPKEDIYSKFPLPAPYVGRPSKESRRIVQAYLGSLLNPALKDLGGWTVSVRLGAARLLHTLVIFAEKHSMDHLEALIPAFTSAVSDDEMAVAQMIVLAVQILGFHIEAEYCLPLVLDIVTSPGASDAQRANGLVVMAGLLFGTPKCRITEKLVRQVSDALSDEDIRSSDHPAVRRQLLAVMTNLLDVGGRICNSSSLNIFLVLLQLQSADGDPQLRQGAIDLADNLATIVGLASVQDLYARHIDCLIPIVTAKHDVWSGSSPAKSLFQTFMKTSGHSVIHRSSFPKLMKSETRRRLELADALHMIIRVGPYLGMIVSMFENCLQETRDPALRISFLQLLDEVLENDKLGPWWSPLAKQVILGLLVPCGVWRTGKVGAAIRHRAMVALGTFLRRDLCSQDQLLEFLKSEKGMLGVIVSCLDEDYYVDTRRVTCHVMQHVIRIAGQKMEDSQRNTVSVEVQKRLDDSNDAVRLGILPAIATFFDTMPKSFSDDLVRTFLINLLVHMDDTNPKIQDAIYLAAEACAAHRPRIVLEVATSSKSRHRSSFYCDKLIAFSSAVDPSRLQTS